MKIIPGKWWMWTGHTFHKFVVRGSVLKDVQYKSVPQKDDEEDKHRIVPDGVKRIDTEAFRYDDLTTQITLPEGLITIDKNAFESCNELRKIHIPASVTYIGEGTFRGCKKVKITVDKKNPRYKVIDKCLVDMVDNKLIAIMSSNEPIIPEFVSKLGYGFVCNPDRIKKIAIPEGVKKLPDYAFLNCDKLTEIRIPNGLDTVGEYAFLCCDNVTIKAPSKSYAIEYAKECGIKYEEF